jgi:hypothetical protein
MVSFNGGHVQYFVGASTLPISTRATWDSYLTADTVIEHVYSPTFVGSKKGIEKVDGFGWPVATITPFCRQVIVGEVPEIGECT